jgi:hypothetical protein
MRTAQKAMRNGQFPRMVGPDFGIEQLFTFEQFSLDVRRFKTVIVRRLGLKT